MKTKAKAPAKDCGCDDYADAVHGTEDGDEFAALADVADEEATDEGPDPRGTTVRRFRNQLLAPYGKPTGDKRRFAQGALSARELPIPLKWQREDNQGHSTSVSVGRIDSIRYADDGVYGSGIFFQPDPEKTPRWAEDCEEAYGLTNKRVVGPSVDLDAMDFHEYTEAEGDDFAIEARPEIEVTQGRMSAVTLVQIPAFGECRPFAMEEQGAGEYAMELEALNALTASGVAEDLDDLPVAKMAEWDMLHWLTETSQVNGAALYSGEQGDLFPVADVVDGQLALIPGAVADSISMLAYHGENIALPEGVKAALRARLNELAVRCGLPLPPWENDPGALVAAGTIDGWIPDRAMFENPNLSGPTPITVRDGRVFGHLAQWGTCHVGFKHCVQPPRSRRSYSHFHVGEIDTTNGPLAVGKITLGGGHADTRLGFQAAAEHYDDAGTAVAAVRAGEDAYGIWISGVALPGKEADFATLPLFPLSGDWRRVGGDRELIAALAVNTPGFLVPRVSVDRGQELALVAAGVLLPEHEAGEGMTAFRDVSDKMREKLAGKGQANPDGSYPIANAEDLQNAVQAYGRAKDKPATRRLIMRMAKKLHREDLIPETWRGRHANDYATDTELLDEVTQEWQLDEALGVFVGKASAGGFHNAFMERLINRRKKKQAKEEPDKKGQPEERDYASDDAARILMGNFADLDQLALQEQALQAAAQF